MVEEHEIVALLERLGAASVREVVDQLAPPRALTTVSTTLGRMLEQGQVTRAWVEGRWVYRLHDHHLEGVQLAAVLASQLQARGPEPMLQVLVGALEQLDPSLLDTLEALLSQRRSRERS
jgi:predicted transcriptional regulator